MKKEGWNERLNAIPGSMYDINKLISRNAGRFLEQSTEEKIAFCYKCRCAKTKKVF